jgi:hypothetical protein
MSETISYYDYTLKLNQSEKTGRWHGSVQVHPAPHGTVRFHGTDRNHVIRQLQARTLSYIKHQERLRVQAKATARLKLNPTQTIKFLALLASDNYHEVLAAARALVKELKRCDVSPEALVTQAHAI